MFATRRKGHAKWLWNTRSERCRWLTRVPTGHRYDTRHATRVRCTRTRERNVRAHWRPRECHISLSSPLPLPSSCQLAASASVNDRYCCSVRCRVDENSAGRSWLTIYPVKSNVVASLQYQQRCPTLGRPSSWLSVTTPKSHHLWSTWWWPIAVCCQQWKRSRLQWTYFNRTSRWTAYLHYQ